MESIPASLPFLLFHDTLSASISPFGFFAVLSVLRSNMRAAALFALACSAAIARADVLEDISDAAGDAAASVQSVAEEVTSSAASVVQSVTTSAVEKPTFTVSRSGAAP